MNIFCQIGYCGIKNKNNSVKLAAVQTAEVMETGTVKLRFPFKLAIVE